MDAIRNLLIFLKDRKKKQLDKINERVKKDKFYDIRIKEGH